MLAPVSLRNLGQHTGSQCILGKSGTDPGSLDNSGRPVVVVPLVPPVQRRYQFYLTAGLYLSSGDSRQLHRGLTALIMGLYQVFVWAFGFAGDASTYFQFLAG